MITGLVLDDISIFPNFLPQTGAIGVESNPGFMAQTLDGVILGMHSFLSNATRLNQLDPGLDTMFYSSFIASKGRGGQKGPTKAWILQFLEQQKQVHFQLTQNQGLLLLLFLVS